MEKEQDEKRNVPAGKCPICGGKADSQGQCFDPHCQQKQLELDSE